MTVRLRYALHCKGRAKNGCITLPVTRRDGESLLRWQESASRFDAVETILAGIGTLTRCEVTFLGIDPPSEEEIFRERWRRLPLDELSEEELQRSFAELREEAKKERALLVENTKSIISGGKNS